MHKNALMKLKNIRKGESVKTAEERRSVSSVVRGSLCLIALHWSLAILVMFE